MQLRGYVRPEHFQQKSEGNKTDSEPEEVRENPATAAMVQHLFDTHRGRRSLIFAGARAKVESVSVKLAEMTETVGVPEEFFAHHGNLSREHREEAERRMKDKSRPASIVCTTTLELGIDVGEIEAVAQIGPGHTVSGMRQRLGRSGRRPGQAAVMRVYVEEVEISPSTHPIDALRVQTVQSIAMLNLMLRKWNEPPEPGRLHLSTLLHQVMALVGQYGGVSAAEAWDVLVRSGTFTAVDVGLFKRLLRRMGDPEVGLLEQAADGTLLAGPTGERLLESRDIFAVFMSSEEFKVVAEGGRAIGQVPGDNPFVPGEFMILAGRRWCIVDVDTKRRELAVRPARGGRPPVFDGAWSPPADGVVDEMRNVYFDLGVPTYLDAAAKQLLAEGRTTFDRLGLRHSTVARHDGRLLLFPWVGERRQQALILALTRAGLAPEPLGLVVSVSAEKEAALVKELKRLVSEPPPSALELARLVENKAVEKFDMFLSDDLLNLSWARDRLDVDSLPTVAATLQMSLQSRSSGEEG